MRGEIGLPRPRTLGQRAAWVFAASALALTLTLGGCRAGGARNAGGQTIQQNQSSGVGSTGAATSSSNNSNSSTSSTGSSNSAALQQLQSIDSQNQNDASQLNQSQSDAGVNYSSQEIQTQP